jgi:hypothetical protein
VQSTVKPTSQQRCNARVQCKRKAAFFAIAAAEAMSDVNPETKNERASTLWMQASKLLSQHGNGMMKGNYGWATLRAVALHAVVMQGLGDASDDAAIQLLALMSVIAPPDQANADLKSLSLETLRESGGRSKSMDNSARSETYIENAPYSIAEARSYVRERAKEVAKDARARSKELFSGQNAPSSLLAVAQSKWVDDDPIPVVLLPMAEFSSDFCNKVLALRSVWSAIKYDDCALAQRRLIAQISDLRKSRPASSLSNLTATKQPSEIPVRITAVDIVKSDLTMTFERVQVKQEKEKMDHPMATFFNPYASKKSEQLSTIIPLQEEQFVSVTFENRLSIPFEIASCKLEFGVVRNDRIKAPAISFVIPGQTKSFSVKFPFIVLENANMDKNGGVPLAIKGVHVTTLSRSLFLKIQQPFEDDEDVVEPDVNNIPPPCSLYLRRDYKISLKLRTRLIKSPFLEIVPPQPILQVCFASSPIPIDDDTIIPAPIADGEVFTLPTLCLWNDPGQSGKGSIEELQISAIGLPGSGELRLFDLSGSKEDHSDTKSKGEQCLNALTVIAECVGVDKVTLNGSQRNSSYLTIKLCAAADTGGIFSTCNVRLRIRYRGMPASPTLEVWRKREIEVRVLRTKGPRISSLSFRCDLFWMASYTNICREYSSQKIGRKCSPSFKKLAELPLIGSSDDEEFVVNRLGQDSGVHACSNFVVVILSVANETSSAIVLTRPDGTDFGLEGSTMSSLTVLPGVSAKVPMVLPRLDRTTELCKQLILMTKLNWRADLSSTEGDGVGVSYGPIIPINRRVRQGSLEIPSLCLKNIVDENPVFLSRIGSAPCQIFVKSTGTADSESIVKVEKGKPLDLSVDVEIASWLSKNLLDQMNLTLEFCCVRKDSETREDAPRDYVWIGHIRKSLHPGKPSFPNPHLTRLLFLHEGTYSASACITFNRLGENEDVKEIWWAEKSLSVKVVHPTRQ